MARTAVGLFLDRSLVGDLIGELEANGFAREEIRVLGEALGMTEPGAMSIAHTDFGVDLIRELRSMGASEDDAEVTSKSDRSFMPPNRDASMQAGRVRSSGSTTLR